MGTVRTLALALSCQLLPTNSPTAPPARPPPPQLHSAFPLHCLVGGGDQLYCDGVFREQGSAALKAWGEQTEQ